MAWREELIIGNLHLQGALYAGSGLGTKRALPGTLTDQVGSIATTATPASGSCGVQFVFSDPDGTAMAKMTSGFFYLSEDAAGLDTVLADTSVAELTNGKVDNIIAKGLSHFVTDAAGKLGITITAVADDYWVVFIIPGQAPIISDVCTCSA